MDKGALEASREGKAMRYTARVSGDQARRSALRSLVDRAFGGRVSQLVQHLADEEAWSEAERSELERLLRETQEERE